MLNEKQRVRNRMRVNRRLARSLEQAAVFLTLALLGGALAQAAPEAQDAGHQAERILRIMLDAPPLTLNPRMAQDVQGQRLSALFFPALTKQTHQLQTQGDLAESFSSNDRFTEWTFKIRSGLKDHEGNPIGPEEVLQCLNHYREGKPLALAIQALEPWKSIRLKGRSLIFELEKSEPYFSRNISVVRYFRQTGRPPCIEPVASSPLIGAGEFRARIYTHAPETELLVDRLQPDGSFRAHAQFLFVRDENTRVIRMLRGEVDLTQNAFSPVRFRWLANRHQDRFHLVEAPGVNVSYLSFNLKHPILSNQKVRKALSLAIPVSELIGGKFANMVEPASSFLSPLLPDGLVTPVERENPNKAAELLDEAGYPKKQDGVRFSLRFKTTPVREGYEPARILQEVFGKLGVKVVLEVVEPAVFLSAVRKGSYELALGRWVGVADPSIFDRTLRSQAPSNRAGYSNTEMDKLLASRQWAQVQRKMTEDIPYFPLWFWKNAVLLRRGVVGVEPSQISLTGALRPLLDARKATTEGSD